MSKDTRRLSLLEAQELSRLGIAIYPDSPTKTSGWAWQNGHGEPTRTEQYEDGTWRRSRPTPLSPAKLSRLQRLKGWIPFKPFAPLEILAKQAADDY